MNRPTVFPMASGAGLMGEAGPEAIMPLKRGPGGRLGVESYGSGGKAPQFNVQVITPPGMTATTEERDNSTGGRDLVVMIDEANAELINRPGSRTGRALQQRYGNQRTLTGR